MTNGTIPQPVTSLHEPGQRSGAWQKMRVNQGQEFVSAATRPGELRSMLWCSAATRARS
jgi:hypothetical protein